MGNNRKGVVVNRYALNGESGLLNELEETSNYVQLSKNCRCRKYTIKGVPASKIDALVADDYCDEHENRRRVIEVCKKQGRYGKEHDRLVFRTLWVQQTEDMMLVDAVGQSDDKNIVILIGMVNEQQEGCVVFDKHYEKLRSNLDDYDLSKVVGWHWTRYYKTPVTYDQAFQLAQGPIEAWLDLSTNPTLAEVNRAASRALYRLARENGYHKLTLRERKGLGLDKDCNQWVSDEVYCARQAIKKQEQFIGEWTLNAAHPSM